MLPFAEFTPLPAQAQLTIYSLLATVMLILGIWAHLRRKPPLESELVMLRTSIESLQAGFAALTAAVKEHASHATEIDALQEKVRGLEAMREEDLRAQRTYTRETTREIFLKLDELKASVSTNFQTVERAIGQLEGKVESLRR